MNHKHNINNAMECAASALATARRLATGLGEPLALQLLSDESESVDRLRTVFGGRRIFDPDVLSAVASLAKHCEEAVENGTTTDFETHETWDERGRDTVGTRTVRIRSDAAATVAAIAEDLRNLQSEIERTLDLVHAEAALSELRGAQSPWARLSLRSIRMGPLVAVCVLGEKEAHRVIVVPLPWTASTAV